MSNITIREARCDDVGGIARVHVEGWRTTYRGIVPDDFLAKLTYEDREQRWRNILCDEASSPIVYVAEDESGQIVGFASGGPERTGDPVYLGELYAVYLLESHRRQGIGRRLVFRVAERLYQYGLNSMLVWVLAANPARHFYESLQAQFVQTQPIEIGGVTLEEVAYGWPDILVLRKLARSRSA